jgi:hypothetical protein
MVGGMGLAFDTRGEGGGPPVICFPMFGTSRLAVLATPIRGALVDRAGEGLVEVGRNRGSRIPNCPSRTSTSSSCCG